MSVNDAVPQPWAFALLFPGNDSHYHDVIGATRVKSNSEPKDPSRPFGCRFYQDYMRLARSEGRELPGNSFNLTLDMRETALMKQDTRKFNRFPISIRLKASDQTGPKFAGVSLCKDISREGMKLSVPFAVEQGTIIHLEISLPDGAEPIEASAKVVWRHEGIEQGYELGIKFLSIDPSDKFRLLDQAYTRWLETQQPKDKT